VTLSLLLDYALLLHPEQQARLENHLPACTVGSLQQQSRMEALVEVVGVVVAAVRKMALRRPVYWTA
jgi:hypothetical protein